MAEYEKPLPSPDIDTKEYWEGCKRHELLIQRCRECGTYRFPPCPMCHVCNSMDKGWAKVSGKGKVYSWIVVTHPTHPAFADEVPYAVVLVEIDEQEGVRIPGNVVDCKPEEMWIGMPVEVVFDDVTEEITLPRWKRLDTPQGF